MYDETLFFEIESIHHLPICVNQKPSCSGCWTRFKRSQRLNVMKNLTTADLHHLPFEVLKKIEIDSKEHVKEHTTNLNTINQNICNQNKTSSRFYHRSLNALKCNKRRNRFGPLEVKSDCPVFVPKPPLPGTRAVKARDPRFSNACGTFHEEGFIKAYGFCDQLINEEKVELKKLLRSKRNKLSSDVQQSLSHELQKLESIEQRRKRLALEKEVKTSLRKTESRLAFEKGKKPYMHSKKNIKEIVQEKIYEELKKGKKLEKYIARQRKKQKSKDTEFAPMQRQKSF
ncbi:ribosomal RNA processing protein 36 homolog [Hylaeus volcanicus]|uniref:ribosomal RNA processing protein 36 homolog n=1 Tax=Hylaeus volcanicus TaxID=313075 RepID=UPI0023B7E5F6|nr:ribosomal RNA processing protein 36 homolog [Hylaeus volcanicus]